MPMALRSPGRPGTSTSPSPVLASAFQMAPVGIDPTYREVPRPLAILGLPAVGQADGVGEGARGGGRRHGRDRGQDQQDEQAA